MSKLSFHEIQLPHPGFYNSVYSGEIDSQEEQYAEHLADEDREEWPEPLQLDGAEHAEILFDVTDYSACYRKLAEWYVDAFSTLAGEALGISAREKVKFWSWADKRYKTEKRDVASLRLTFGAMDSPREYNFTTDRVFANIPASVIRKMWSISKEDDHATLTRVADDRHTSYDGFISHYRADWTTWGAVMRWDHNQLETLLRAACEVRGFDWQDSDLSIYYATTEDGSSAYDTGVDYAKRDEKVTEKRAEKLAEWLEDDPESAKAWIGHNAEKARQVMQPHSDMFDACDLSNVTYRCDKTPDMFSGMES